MKACKLASAASPRLRNAASFLLSIALTWDLETVNLRLALARRRGTHGRADARRGVDQGLQEASGSEDRFVVGLGLVGVHVEEDVERADDHGDRRGTPGALHASKKRHANGLREPRVS